MNGYVVELYNDGIKPFYIETTLTEDELRKDIESSINESLDSDQTVNRKYYGDWYIDITPNSTISIESFDAFEKRITWNTGCFFVMINYEKGVIELYKKYVDDNGRLACRLNGYHGSPIFLNGQDNE